LQVKREFPGVQTGTSKEWSDLGVDLDTLKITTITDIPRASGCRTSGAEEKW